MRDQVIYGNKPFKITKWCNPCYSVWWIHLQELATRYTRVSRRAMTHNKTGKQTRRRKRRRKKRGRRRRSNKVTQERESMANSGTFLGGRNMLLHMVTDQRRPRDAPAIIPFGMCINEEPLTRLQASCLWLSLCALSFSNTIKQGSSLPHFHDVVYLNCITNHQDAPRFPSFFVTKLQND